MRILTVVVCLVCGEGILGGLAPSASCSKDSNCPSGQKCVLEHCVFDSSDCFINTKANLGWGPHACHPYSYESFIIAARYFPNFGTESPDNGYTKRQNSGRDLAAFFSHAVQETGENHPGPYKKFSKEKADSCYYRGGFFNWFEGGPTSSFMPPNAPGHNPEDGDICNKNGRYCSSSGLLDFYYPCSEETDGRNSDFSYKDCYFGRGAIQISYNYNYGQFQDWLHSQNIMVDLLKNPNLVMTKKDPPLAVLASMWFYMTPQPPKPAMHDIVIGNWEPGTKNRAAGYKGPIFGPTSLIINNECGGEDPDVVGGPGESRRIKAFKWFTSYFNVPIEEERLLTCKGMPVPLEGIRHNLSYGVDWLNSWKEQPCNCAPAAFGGMIPYFQPNYYPDRFVALNEENRLRCVKDLYERPDLFQVDPDTNACLSHLPEGMSTNSTKVTTTSGTSPSAETTAEPSEIITTPTSPDGGNTDSTDPTQNEEIIVESKKDLEWQGGGNKKVISLHIILKNTSNRKLCDVKILIDDKTTPIQSFWGVVDNGDSLGLPSWQTGIDAGQEIGKNKDLGIIVEAETLPTFSANGVPC